MPLAPPVRLPKLLQVLPPPVPLQELPPVQPLTLPALLPMLPKKLLKP